MFECGAAAVRAIGTVVRKLAAGAVMLPAIQMRMGERQMNPISRIATAIATQL